MRLLRIHSRDPVVDGHEFDDREQDDNSPKDRRCRDKQPWDCRYWTLFKGGSNDEKERQRIPERHELTERGG